MFLSKAPYMFPVWTSDSNEFRQKYVCLSLKGPQERHQSLNLLFSFADTSFFLDRNFYTSFYISVFGMLVNFNNSGILTHILWLFLLALVFFVTKWKKEAHDVGKTMNFSKIKYKQNAQIAFQLLWWCNTAQKMKLSI